MKVYSGGKNVSRSLLQGTLCVMMVAGLMLPATAQEVDNPFTSYYVETAPTVDGEISAGEYVGDGVTISTANGFNVEWGGANAQVDASDCSYTVYSVWTDDALYFALDIIDDEAAMGDFMNGDTIQIVLAELGATAREAGSLADFAYHPDDGPVWRNNEGGGDIDWGSANLTSDFEMTDNGFSFEARFPWSDFNIDLPTLEDGAQLRNMITVVDVDPSKEGDYNAFVISSGGPSDNPFQNHEDISELTLVQEEAADPEALVWDFCDEDLQGWSNANQSPLSWDGSRMVVNMVEEMPDGNWDPHIAVGGLSHDLEAYPELAVKMTVENAPRAFNIGVFSFREDAGHITPTFSGVDNGEHILRLNYLDEFPEEEDWTLTSLRLDIPDNEPFQNGGAWPDFQDMVVTIDWVALTDDPEFEAAPCPVVVEITGPAMAVSGEDVTLWADVSGNAGEVSYQWWKDGEELDGETDNYLELLSVIPDDGGTYAVQVTDDNGAVTEDFTLEVVEALPVGNLAGLALLVLATSVAGMALIRRRTT